MRKNEPYATYEPLLYSSLINYTKPRLRPPIHILIRFTRFTPFISSEARIAKHIFSKNHRVHFQKKDKNLIPQVAGGAAGSLLIPSHKISGWSVNAGAEQSAISSRNMRKSMKQIARMVITMLESTAFKHFHGQAGRITYGGEENAVSPTGRRLNCYP
ncbi:MAG: hypothetical protein U9O96_06300 [Candidatus Thermoplasmatota archaeon]|nr:hypothetical protein [Candidatus Thermoplasmatota archaeon]